MVNLTELGWPSLVPEAGGLEIAATCTIRELHEFVPRDDWLAGSLLRAPLDLLVCQSAERVFDNCEGEFLHAERFALHLRLVQELGGNDDCCRAARRL